MCFEYVRTQRVQRQNERPKHPHYFIITMHPSVTSDPVSISLAAVAVGRNLINDATTVLAMGTTAPKKR